MTTKSTLFIDESGKASLTSKADEPFILTGIILDDEEVTRIEGFFNYIKLKYKIDVKVPFHSYDIFENPEGRLSDSTLLSLSKTLAEFLELIPCRIFISIVDKKIFRQTLGVKSLDDFKGSKERKELSEAPHILCSAYLFAKFAKYLKDNERVGQIIVDARRGADSQLLKTMYRCKEGSIPFREEYKEPVREKLHAICFAEKGYLSGGVELTDLISYVTFFHVRRMMSHYKKQGIPLMWKSIKQRAEFHEVSEADVRGCFRLKKDEVHRALKS